MRLLQKEVQQIPVFQLQTPRFCGFLCQDFNPCKACFILSVLQIAGLKYSGYQIAYIVWGKIQFYFSQVCYQSFKLYFSILCLLCLTKIFYAKFHAKNRYRSSRATTRAISALPVKFSVEFTSQATDFP